MLTIVRGFDLNIICHCQQIKTRFISDVNRIRLQNIISCVEYNQDKLGGNDNQHKIRAKYMKLIIKMSLNSLDPVSVSRLHTLQQFRKEDILYCDIQTHCILCKPILYFTIILQIYNTMDEHK